MLLKSADDKSSDIETLKSLLHHSNATPDVQKKIENEIKFMLSGIKGENEAAFELNFYYGDTSKNHVIIHDLRLEIAGRVAQIDHLIINRFLEIWVCESKRFSEGIAINDHGEFSAFYGNRPYGVPSPFEQNNKHIQVLSDMFKTGVVELPKRLGLSIKPAFKSMVLISKNARISRPDSHIDGIENILKVDQFVSHVQSLIEKDNNVLAVAKIISQDTLKELALKIVENHKPIKFDWATKFGLTKEQVDILPLSEVPIELPPVEEKKSKLICFKCNDPVPLNVARFCWFNKKKFGGNVYCQVCQKLV